MGVNSLYVNMTWENPISFYCEIKVIIIIMIIDAYYPEDVYGHRNGSILGGCLCTNHWASRPYWGKFNVNVHSHTM